MPTNLSFAVPTSSKLDTCEVTGFESRVREECEEVSEVECTPIEVKKIKTEIREKCEVKLNKTCEVQFSPAPTEKCHPTTKRRSHHNLLFSQYYLFTTSPYSYFQHFRCSVDFKIISEPKYKEECAVDVEHICEDYVHVPYPDHGYGHHPEHGYGHPEHEYGQPEQEYGHHVQDSYGPPAPFTDQTSDTYAPKAAPILNSDNYGTMFSDTPVKPVPILEDGYGVPRANPLMKDNFKMPNIPSSMEDTFRMPKTSAIVDNTFRMSKSQSTQLANLDESKLNLLAVQLFSRSKRSAQAQITDMSEEEMRELLTTAIMKEMKSKTEDELFENLSDMFSARAEEIKQTTSTTTTTTTQSPKLLGGSFQASLPFLESAIMEEIRKRTSLAHAQNVTELGGSVPLNTTRAAPASELGGVLKTERIPDPGVIIGIPLPGLWVDVLQYFWS